jgi:hypothetical protein
MERRKNPVPKVAFRLRALTKDVSPDDAKRMKDAANYLVYCVKTMGLHNEPPERWQGLRAYRKAAELLAEITGKTWYGEVAGHQKPIPFEAPA